MKAQVLDPAVLDLEKFLEELEKLSMQTVVHKKKFEYSLSQMRNFLDEYSKNYSQTQYISSHSDVKHSILNSLNNIRELMLEYDKHRWTVSTIENPSNTVGTALRDISLKLRRETETFCKTGSEFFDNESKLWVEYHILDLRGIAASFNNYINRNDPGDATYRNVEKRLRSIEAAIQNHEKEATTSCYRVFSPIPLNYQSWRINHEELIYDRKIGSGVSSDVYHGYDKRDGNEVAIKEMKFDILTGAKLQAFQREISILASVRHSCLIGFIGATEKPPYCIVTEWMGGGTLFAELHTRKRLSNTMLSIAIYDIARGMQFLHSRSIVHRDLKSLNVLFDTRGFAHICDFGFSRREDGKMTQSIGTVQWMAPEVLESGCAYGSKVDVYSFGIVLWEVLTREMPFAGLDTQTITAMVVSNDARPEIPVGAPEGLAKLIRKCWDRSPDVRPTFDDIVKLLQTGDILLQGADKKKFLEYASQFEGQVNYQIVHIESQLEESSLGEEKFIQFIETLEREGVPPNLVERCWLKFMNHLTSSRDELKARCSVLFLKTPMKLQASEIIRKLPVKSIPYEIITNAVELIPTGRDDTDTNIVIAACKNDCADAASVYAIDPKHIKLALEIVAQNGVHLILKAAVADRCVQCLGNEDPAMVCTALRCLIGIGEIRRITPTALNTYMQSPNSSIRNCIFIAAATLAKEGISIPVKLSDKMLDEINSSSCAGTCLVSSCNVEEIASNVLQKIRSCNLSIELVLRILIMSLKHQKLVPEVKRIASELKIEGCSEEIRKCVKEIVDFESPKPSPESKE